MNFRELMRTLRVKLGASVDREGHHIYYRLSIGKRDYRVGKVSHSERGSKQVPDFVIKDTAQRLRLTKQEFHDFVGCFIDKNGHMKLWRERESGLSS